MSIPTPVNAEKVNELSLSQLELIRQSFGINDNPFQSDKTYIVFDADAGNNNLNLDTAGSSTYSILKGDGTVSVPFTDTGGTKVLNYVVAGRYLITIDGPFQGIDLNGVPVPDRGKYISITAGSNYPTTFPIFAFKDAINLEYICCSSNTAIAGNVFNGCLKLKTADFPLAASIGANAFDGCVELVSIVLKNVVAIGADAFSSVVLSSLVIKSASDSQALLILNAIVTAGGAYATGFSFIFNNTAGQYVYGTLKVAKSGDPNMSYENLADNSGIRFVTKNFKFDDGVGYIIRAIRDGGTTFEDAYLNFISGLGNLALSLRPDGSLQALITYSKSVGATNKFLFIDDAGVIGVGAALKDLATYSKSIGATNKPLYIDSTGVIGTDGEIQGAITIPTGNWNMNTLATLTVPFPSGIDFNNCTGIEVFIIDDGSITKSSIWGDGGLIGSSDGSAVINASGAFISRRTGGGFDNTNYDTASFNRGHVTFRFDKSL